MELRLEEIARCKTNDGNAIILPPVQRGLVWNAVRAEVLWDSILRGLPIGTFSIRKSAGGWELMDGQQRSHAIGMAFSVDQLKSLSQTELSAARAAIAAGKVDLESEALRPILWIDIAGANDVGSNGESRYEEDGVSRRQFKFKVTTASDPWGYRNSESETNDDPYLAEERQLALAESFKAVGTWKIGERPLPYEVWPKAAAFPVPMPILVEFIQTESDDTFAAFRKWCGGKKWVCESNWYRHNGFKAHEGMACGSSWGRIVDSVRRAMNDFRVAAYEVHVEPEDVGVYFSRMNRAGKVPTVEEIQYCLLKDALRNDIERKTWEEFDALAASIGVSPARLFSMSVRIVNNIESNKPQGLAGELKLSDVMGCRTQLAQLFSTGLLLSNGRKVVFFDLVKRAVECFCGGDSILHWVLKDVVTSDDGIVFLWYLHLLTFGEPLIRPGNLTDTGLLTYVLWFSVDVVSSVRELWACGRDVSSGLYKAIRDNLLMPVMPDELRRIDAIVGDDSIECMDFLGQMRNAWNEDSIKDRLNRFWCGFSTTGSRSDFQPCHGRSLLIYACRSYLQEVFKGYVPGQPQWVDQNSPWDLDHVLPKSWLNENSDDSMTSAYSSLVWSIGNALPVPFQINRSKNAQPPDEYYPYRRDDVPSAALDSCAHCAVEKTGCHLMPQMMDVISAHPQKRDENWFDKQDASSVASFCRETWKRIESMYLDWYESCGIASVFEVAHSEASKSDVRNMLMHALLDRGRREELECGLWYVSGNREYPVVREEDLMHPWISFGVKIENALISVSASEFAGGKFQVGLRKDPSAPSVNAEFGRRLASMMTCPAALCKGDDIPPPLGTFYNSGWWYYYQSPRRLNSPSADHQVERAYRMFKDVYEVICQLLMSQS